MWQKMVGVVNGGGSGSNLTFDLLWTNSSPTSSFSPQTINIDLSDYSNIVVVSKGNTGLNDAYQWDIVKISNNTTRWTNVLGVARLSNYKFAMVRPIRVNNDLIEFYNGYNIKNDGNASGIDNNTCIPYKIYGMKGETDIIASLDELLP